VGEKAALQSSAKQADGRRSAVRGKLAEALGGDEVASSLASNIEAGLFRELAPGPRYQRQVRDLLFNMRGEAGAGFREAIRSGGLPIRTLASLHTEDIAPAEKKAQRAQVRQQAMEARETDWELRREETPMNRTFTCGKCGGNRTWYFQFQTRACDEPMEFFVMCRECHHGWRHNNVSPDDIFRQVWSA